VVCPRGLGQFEIQEDIEEHAVCPKCREAVEVETFGFYKCLWSFKGREENTGEWKVSEQRAAFSSTEVSAFEDLGVYDVRFLKIRVERIPRFELFLYFNN
jgi:hypothetical protein